MRYRVLAGGFVLLLLTITVWLLLAGARAVNAAVVVTCTLTAALVALAIFPPPWRVRLGGQDRLAAEAENLARAIFDREAREQGKFLAQAGNAQAANVAFSPPSWVFWRSDGGEKRGLLNTIDDFYERLDRGRLVVLGEPGSGKTVLANQLLLDRIGVLLSDVSSLRPGVGIPVRLSLSAFDPGPESDNSDVLSHRLEDWISRRIAEDFRMRKEIAARLVRNDWILPVLDGLDEMDGETSSGSQLDGKAARRANGETDDANGEFDDAQGAPALMRALNASVRGRLRPVVVTCRTDRYKQLCRPTLPGHENALLNATTVELEPLDAEEVVRYLTSRFPDPVDNTQVERRWRAVVRHIQARPRGHLASVLSSPLRLFMAVTAYYRPDTRPAEMIRVTKGNLSRHLFDRYIPAVIEQHPGDGSSRYRADDVRAWLGTIATYLRAQGPEAEVAGSDLRLDQLWRAVGTRAPRYLAAAVYGLLTVALLAGADWWYSYSVDHPLDTTRSGKLVIVAAAVIVLWITWQASRPRVSVARLAPFPLRSATGRRVMARGLVGLLIVGLFVSLPLGLIIATCNWIRAGFTGWLTVGLIVGLTSGAAILPHGSRTSPISISINNRMTSRLFNSILILTVCGAGGSLAAGFILWGQHHESIQEQLSIVPFMFAALLIAAFLLFILGLRQGPSAIYRPSDLITLGYKYNLTLGFVLICFFGLVGGFLGWIGFGSIGLESFVALGLAVGVGFSQRWNADTPWLRYLLAATLLTSQGQLPRRPALFFNWAYNAGLLRLSGISIQFRHREFQDWLSESSGGPGKSHVRGLTEIGAGIVIAAIIISLAITGINRIGVFLAYNLTDPGGSVSMVSFSPDGRELAASGDSGQTWLWAVPSGHLIATLTVPQSELVSAQAFGPGGRTLAVAYGNGTTYLWDTASWQQVGTFTDPHTEGVSALAFDSGGRTLAVADDSGTTYLWNVASGRRIGSFPDPYVLSDTSIAFGPDFETQAEGDAKGRIWLWNRASRRQIGEVTDPHTRGINSLMFSPNGKTLAAVDFSGAAYLWDVASRREVTTFALPHTQRISGLTFSPSGSTVALTGISEDTYLWDLASHRLTAIYPSNASVSSVAFSPNGRTLAVAEFPGRIDLWNTASGHRVTTLIGPHSSGVNSVVFSPSGTTLAAGDVDGNTYLWNLNSKRRIATFADPYVESGVNRVAFSPDGATLAVADSNHIYIWNVASKRVTATLSASEIVTSLAFSPDGKTLADGDYAGYVQLWNVASWRQAATLADNDTSVSSVAFSPSGATLAAGNYKGAIYVWNVASKRHITTFDEPNAGSINSLAFSPNGTELAASNDAYVYLWHVTSGRRVYVWHVISERRIAEEYPVNSVEFSPSGSTLACTDTYGITYFFKLSSHRLSTFIIDPKSQGLTSAAFSPDGEILATSDANGSIYVWHLG